MAFKLTWCHFNKYQKRRLTAMVVIYVICVADMILCIVRHTSPWINNFCRPIVVFLYLSQCRTHFFSVLVLIKDSFVIISSIFVYVAVYSFAGYFVFKNTLEGYSYFRTPGIAFFEMFVCLTTSNFPDVMLPAYNENRWYCLFFVFYMMIGMFFLMNVLLATVFENYKRHILERAEKKVETRE